MTDAIPAIGQELGHYRIVEKIGAGGMGVVFHARDQRLERDVALKVLPKQALLTEAAQRQFRCEALSLARITDPHVAMAFDFGQDSGINYLVTEYVPGVTLDAKLAGRPLPEAEILQLGKQLASGLEAAHKEGVIHRDLKPSNLKITPDGRLKILDFGLAYMLRTAVEVSETAPLTETYSDAGTLPYMGPEQLKGHTPDERADLWSAGVVLYEMSTGKHPFGDSTGTRLIAAILEQTPVPPRVANSKISEGLERIILRAMQKDPKERYQSAGDLRIDLANLATGTMPIYLGPTPLPNWRHWLPIIVLAAVVLVGVGYWWVGHRGGAPALDATMMAVLPFESVANDSPTNALGRGLTETVTAKLVQAVDGGHLQLVSTRDLIEHGVKTSEQAQREFGTDLVLEGTLQQDGARIRITWSLVNPRTHTQIAANTITGDTNDIFGLQDTIFDDVFSKLPRRPTPAGGRNQKNSRIRSPPRTTSICEAADIWRITRIRTTSIMLLQNFSTPSSSTRTTLLHMRRWGWRTTLALYGRIGTKTGWTRRRRLATVRLPLCRSWRKVTLAWEISSYPPDATKMLCRNSSARSISITTVTRL